ncbi:MAG: glycerate kinase [Solirubrobacterales bacterium]
MRPVLVAPDKFKGTLTAGAVATAIAGGLERAGIASDICRIADGGEGTLDIVAEATGATVVDAAAHDALGRPVGGRVAVFNNGKSALVQASDAIGLDLIDERDRDAVGASSYGAGELIAAAAALDVRQVFVGVGGTATTDGGAGALEALRAARLLGARGATGRAPRLTVLCDARAAWEQAAPVFAPQKGASASQAKELAARLDSMAVRMPRDPRGVLLTGCGGGLSGALWAYAGAELKSGAGFVLDRLDFTARMTAARGVVTGEGRLDHQTLLGKAVGEVATRARQSGVPCHAIVGRREMTEFEARILDFESVTEASTRRAIEVAASRLATVLATQ